MRAAIFLCPVLLLPCCSDPQREPDRLVGVSDAGTGPPVPLSAILGKPLDSLTPAEALTLCSEDARRTDYCLNWGFRSIQSQGNPLPPAIPWDVTCRQTVSQCRDATTSGTPDVDCTGFNLGSSPCPVLVSEYFACLDAWNASLSCDNAGYEQQRPPECDPLASECDLFKYAFHFGGTSRPCPSDAGVGVADTNDDIYGLDPCRPTPARFVIIGDSIASCSSPNLDPAQCGPKLIADHIRNVYVPDLIYESYAVAGSLVRDMPGQALAVPSGPGHVFVWSNVVGNDILDGNIDYGQWKDAWEKVFGTFTDASRFPDGVTFLFNTQYGPYDQCGAPNPTESALLDANQRLYVDVAMARPDAVAVDEYPDWLGHGQHAGELSCGRCSSDDTPWLSVDGIHPNAAGFAHMAAKWSLAIDRMLGGCG